MELSVDPEPLTVDVVPTVRLTGATPGTTATLTINTVDAAGHSWRSTGDYSVDDDGVIGADDPERPWWSMKFVDEDAAPVAFTAPDDALPFQLGVEIAGLDGKLDVARRWSIDVDSREHRGDGWLLRVYRPRSVGGPQPAVFIVPGSTGLSAMAPTAALLATHGYVAGVLAYMQEPGLPSSFERIPLESVTAAMMSFAALDEVDAERVVVHASSVGTSVALSALTPGEAPKPSGIVLVAPTHVVWQALPEGGRPPPMSSLTRGGKDLPYVPIKGERLLGQVAANAVRSRVSRHPTSHALKMGPAFDAGLKDGVAAAAAAIPVERIEAPILALAGGADAMWPSARMAKALRDRRRAHGAGTDDRVIVVAKAGHFLRPPLIPTTVDRNDSLVSGGTPAGNAAGARTAWDATLAFLADRLGQATR
jgi:dienelactone hydrolase